MVTPSEVRPLHFGSHYYPNTLKALVRPGLDFSCSFTLLTCFHVPEMCLVWFHFVPFSDFYLFPFFSAFILDVACWRDGGKAAGSPSSSDQDEKLPGQDESIAGTSEQNDILKVVEKRIACGPPQAKLNGQQAALASQYRAMMPPYVSIVK